MLLQYLSNRRHQVAGGQATALPGLGHSVHVELAGLAPDRYVAAQGTALQRAGRVHVERDDSGTVWVGGHSVTCVTGTVVL